MRITCPSCSAAYEVPDTLLGAAPRRVRCARCGHEWLPTPQSAIDAPVQTPVAPKPMLAPAPPSPPPLVAEPSARPAPPSRLAPDFERLPATDEDERAGRSTLIAWVLTVLVLAAAGWAAVAYRHPVMEAWPPSQRVYHALGLDASPPRDDHSASQ
jgi:predicted Zn finger-like uncharacterized protein